MDLNLTGRVALITGGSKGIGRAIALALAQEGVDTAICARGAEELDKTAQETRSATGRRSLPVAADLSKLEECQRFVQTAADQYGRVDILVCCANISGAGGAPFGGIPDEQWIHHLDTKLFGAVRCSREVLPHMKKNGWGRIILISGMATRLVRLLAIDNGPICAAVANFGKQLSAQVVGDGIRVNTIHPDFTRTGLLESHLARQAKHLGITVEEMERDQVSKFPLGRFIEPGEIANLAVFLCSDRADAITGQSIAVDGGAAVGVYY